MLSKKITPSVIELRRGGGGSELVALHEERGITRSTLVCSGGTSYLTRSVLDNVCGTRKGIRLKPSIVRVI